jgi:hypothetical protein
MTTKLIVILLLAASTMAVYAVQKPDVKAASGLLKADDALPYVEGVEIPRIVIVAKREHVADHQR